MSNNAFSFADQLRINSKLRAQFAELCEEYMDEGNADLYAAEIVRHGAEDLVAYMLENYPDQMAQQFRVY